MSEYKHDVVFDHEYDGIQEFDNRLPNWWLFILYATVIFSLGYWLFLHTYGIGDLQLEKYEKEMAAAQELMLAQASAGGITDESLTLAASLPDKVAEGKALFTTYCVVCHAAQGEGLVGPNLTDAYWVHGGKPTDIHRIITDGVPAKGMAAWGSQLGPTRVEKLAVYVVSIMNTNVSGKAPEGELVE